MIPLLDEKSAELRYESEDKPNIIVVGRKNLLPIRNYFDIVKGEDDVVPGIKLLLAPGHTPGYVAVMISSGRKQLLCVGDLLHETAEFSTPGLWTRSDHSPEEAADTRDRIISLAADSEAMVFITHFPLPGLGYIVRKGGGLDWKPFKNP